MVPCVELKQRVRSLQQDLGEPLITRQADKPSRGGQALQRRTSSGDGDPFNNIYQCNPKVLRRSGLGPIEFEFAFP